MARNVSYQWINYLLIHFYFQGTTEIEISNNFKPEPFYDKELKSPL